MEETLTSAHVDPDRLESLEYMVDVYSRTMREALDIHAEKWWTDKNHWAYQKGIGPVKARKMLRCDVNMRAFANGSRRTYERGGMRGMFDFQHKFKWRQLKD